MLNKISSNLNRIMYPDKPRLKILTMPTHEGYQSLLAKTGHEFYMIRVPNAKGWDYHTRPLPENHYYYTSPIDKMRGDVHFDIVLCQNRLAQWDVLNGIAKQFGIPLVVLDHTEPPPGISPQDFWALCQRIGDVNVFITEHNQRTWRNLAGTIIPHGIDTETFTGYTGDNPTGISVVNHFAQRDIFCGWNLWTQIAKEVPITLVGENPGISKSINNISELVETLASHRYYLNTSQLSPVPLSVLEAMSVGLPIVTTAHQELPKIIQNGYNGFISNDPQELINYCKVLQQDHTLAKELGNNARKTIEEKFSLAQFVDNWNEVFQNARQI